MADLNVAIVGLGYWGPNLARNFTASPKWNVHALVDSDPTRLAKLSRLYPNARTTATYDDVLSDQAVDAVAIATPPELHYTMARDALAARKHVLIEKPLSATADEGYALKTAAEASGVVLMVDHTFIYTGAVETLRSCVERSTLGKIYYIDSVRTNLGLFQPGGSVVRDLAPHDVSIMNFILQEYPEAVSATSVSAVTGDTADVAYATLRYASGAIGHLNVSWIAPVKVRKLIVAGSAKMAIWDDIEPSEKVKIYDKGVDVGGSDDARAKRLVSYRAGDMFAPAIDLTEALAKVVDDFHAAVTGGKTPRATARDGIAVVEALEAMEASLGARGAFVPIRGLTGQPERETL